MLPHWVGFLKSENFRASTPFTDKQQNLETKQLAHSHPAYKVQSCTRTRLPDSSCSYCQIW